MTDAPNSPLPDTLPDMEFVKSPLKDQYDVIVVGGRPSGSSLAARLGMQGLSVLLIDRAAFPVLPAVSSPIIYGSTMKLLDEIGANEDEYARNTPQIRTVVTEAREIYRAVAHVPMGNGRDYAYAIDRGRFDHELWRNAARFESVTALDEFSALDLLWEEDQSAPHGKRVAGIIGKPKGGTSRPIRAKLVVGADGKFSMIARKVGAGEYNADEGRTTSLYYAYWRNLKPYDVPGALMYTHGTMDGFGYLIMHSADDTVAIVVEGYQDVIEQYGEDTHSAEEHYLKLLQHSPRVWERVKDAERVTSVRGLKGTENFYRQPYGPGWALVGDAAHHKDPLGGQGIYDAVFGAKILSEAIVHYAVEGVPFEKAMYAYQARLQDETLPMYRNTLAARINFEPQGMLQRWLGRYASENRNFMTNLMSVPARLKTPEEVVTPGLLIDTLAQGLTRDVRRIMTGEPSPAAVPPLPGQSVPANHSLGLIGWALAIPAIAVMGGIGLIKALTPPSSEHH